MLGLVLGIRARLLSSSELALVRDFDWSCPIKELGACIRGGCRELSADDGTTASRLSASNASRVLPLFEHTVGKHLAVEESHVALVLVGEAAVDIVGLELPDEVLSTSWTSKERVRLSA